MTNPFTWPNVLLPCISMGQNHKTAIWMLEYLLYSKTGGFLVTNTTNKDVQFILLEWAIKRKTLDTKWEILSLDDIKLIFQALKLLETDSSDPLTVMNWLLNQASGGIKKDLRVILKLLIVS